MNLLANTLVFNEYLVDVIDSIVSQGQLKLKWSEFNLWGICVFCCFLAVAHLSWMDCSLYAQVEVPTSELLMRPYDGWRSFARAEWLSLDQMSLALWSGHLLLGPMLCLPPWTAINHPPFNECFSRCSRVKWDNCWGWRTGLVEAYGLLLWDTFGHPLRQSTEATFWGSPLRQSIEAGHWDNLWGRSVLCGKCFT